MAVTKSYDPMSVRSLTKTDMVVRLLTNHQVKDIGEA